MPQTAGMSTGSNPHEMIHLKGPMKTEWTFAQLSCIPSCLGDKVLLHNKSFYGITST